MEKKKIKKDSPEYHMGVDLAYCMKWWQKLLVFFKIVRRGRFQDYTCYMMYKKLPDGTLEVVDINYY